MSSTDSISFFSELRVETDVDMDVDANVHTSVETDVHTNVHTNVETDVHTNVHTNVETHVYTSVETRVETHVELGAYLTPRIPTRGRRAVPLSRPSLSYTRCYAAGAASFVGAQCSRI